jgi:hypothetical protein
MYSIPALLRQQLNQILAPEVAAQESSAPAKPAANFDTLVAGILSPDQNKQVNEEELFAGLVLERVYATKGQETGDAFKLVLDKHREQNTGKGGYIFEEKAARDALKEFSQSGSLSSDEADQIHSQAFGAAQLDTNLAALYDSTGGPGDSTKAILGIELALSNAKQALEKYSSGAQAVPLFGLHADYSIQGSTTGRSISSTPGNIDKTDRVGRKNKLDGNDGLLWKPVSETLGKAIMMLAPEYAGQVKSIQLVNSEGKIVDKARYFSGGSDMYPREKWVFRRPGADYPENVTVQIKLNDGDVQRIKIPRPGQRYD